MTDLVDEAHPPPVELAPPNQPVSDQLWEVVPSTTLLPFRLDLPVMLGPPPYKLRKNAISYLLSVLVEAKVDRKRVYVRTSEEVIVLTVHDPEKALLNLTNPLVVTDEVHLSHRSSLETITLTAGVHRQTWISGYPLFVDIKVQNHGNKVVRKVELQLERLTFVYAHAAPSEEAGLGDTLRLPDRCEKELISKAAFFWCLQVWSRSTQNSIDIPPNSIAQVAATIEHKHRNRPPSTSDAGYSYRPGQAFLAARRQSFEQVTRDTISQRDLDDIAEALHDPRQRPQRRASTTHIDAAPPSNNSKTSYRHSRFREGSEGFRNPPRRPPPAMPTLPSTNSSQQNHPSIPQRRTHRASLEEQTSRQRLLSHEAAVDRRSGNKSSLDNGLKYRGPRLQRSTSGLKFSSSSENDNGHDDDDDEGGLEAGGSDLRESYGDRRARLRKTNSRCESRLPLRN
ncbi:MAG: hypothetical protein Q9220_006047 [cf. Caloplaca sp. 1 TL-2023]